jgi:hypothetical protein
MNFVVGSSVADDLQYNSARRKIRWGDEIEGGNLIAVKEFESQVPMAENPTENQSGNNDEEDMVRFTTFFFIPTYYRNKNSYQKYCGAIVDPIVIKMEKDYPTLCSERKKEKVWFSISTLNKLLMQLRGKEFAPLTKLPREFRFKIYLLCFLIFHGTHHFNGLSRKWSWNKRN